jgi:hypothetical protein
VDDELRRQRARSSHHPPRWRAGPGPLCGLWRLRSSVVGGGRARRGTGSQELVGKGRARSGRPGVVEDAARRPLRARAARSKVSRMLHVLVRRVDRSDARIARENKGDECRVGGARRLGSPRREPRGRSASRQDAPGVGQGSPRARNRSAVRARGLGALVLPPHSSLSALAPAPRQRAAPRHQFPREACRTADRRDRGDRDVDRDAGAQRRGPGVAARLERGAQPTGRDRRFVLRERRELTPAGRALDQDTGPV